MCSTLTVGSCFRRVRSTFCSFVQQLELRKFKTSVPGQNKKERPETFFRHYATFLDYTEGSPFICFDILQQNGCQKIPKGPSFTFFGTVTLFKNLILKFFENFSKSPKGPPFNFFHIVQPAGVSKSSKGPLLHI